jgi:hypothetical protein
VENEQLYHSVRPEVGCSLLSLLTHLQCGDNYCEIKKIILMQLGYRQENAFKTLRKFHLSMMKPSAFIINTSRGKLANNKELAEVSMKELSPAQDWTYWQWNLRKILLVFIIPSVSGVSGKCKLTTSDSLIKSGSLPIENEADRYHDEESNASMRIPNAEAICAV